MSIKTHFNLESWKGAQKGGKRCILKILKTYTLLTHVFVRQKPTQHCKAIILQFFKKDPLHMYLVWFSEFHSQKHETEKINRKATSTAAFALSNSSSKEWFLESKALPQRCSLVSRACDWRHFWSTLQTERFLNGDGAKARAPLTRKHPLTESLSQGHIKTSTPRPYLPKILHLIGLGSRRW